MYNQTTTEERLLLELKKLRYKYNNLMDRAHTLSNMVVASTKGIVAYDDYGKCKRPETNEAKLFVFARRLLAQTTYKRNPKHVERRKDPQSVFEFYDKRF